MDSKNKAIRHGLNRSFNGGLDGGRAGRDGVLAKKRARVDLLDRLETRTDKVGEISALRLLAEVDLALSEPGSNRRADGLAR